MLTEQVLINSLG